MVNSVSRMRSHPEYVVAMNHAKIGQSDSPESSAIGPHGLGERNERGDRLVDFATANEMVIANTLFKQHRRRLYTWTSPDGNTRNQIDYFCIDERWKTSVVNTKTLPGADCGSDHELLVMSMRVKIKKTKAAKHPIRYDMIHIPEQFNVDIKNRLNTAFKSKHINTIKHNVCA